MKQVASLRYFVIFKKAFSEPDIFKAFVKPKEYARMKEEYSMAQLQQDKFEQGRFAEKQELARNMLAEGIEPVIVAKITGISPDDLATLSQ